MQSSKQKPMKVLIIAPTLDTIVGGQAIQTDRLMRKMNQEPDVQMDIQSIAPSVFPRLEKIMFVRTLIRETKYLYDIVTKIPKYDLIHVCSAAHFSFLLAPTPAVLVAKLFRKKTLLNYRSGQLRAHYRYWRWSLVPTLKLFDKIVTPSEYLVDAFSEIGFKAESIYNFVDIDLFTFRQRQKLRPVFLSNRLLEPLYNIPCILRAFKIIQAKYPDAKLTVSGFGHLRESLEELAVELGLKNVEFTGKVSQKQMAALYDQADVYLNSPNTDNMPGSLIECYASGLPIVTTRAGGIPYILEHEKTGLMVDKNDHEALAGQAMRLLEDEELARQIIGNGQEYVKRFTWHDIRLKWLAAYRELLNSD